MHDAALVHVLDGIRNLTKIFPDNALLKWSFFFLSLAKLTLQVACRSPLKDNHQIVFIDEGIHVSDDIRVVKGLQ